VRYYLKLLKTQRVKPLPPNEKLIAEVRKKLQGVPVAKRYYALFVNSLIGEKYDEGAEDTRANQKYPPITLQDLFADRPEVLKLVKSAQFQKEKRYKQVDGPYTEKGHYRVLRNVKEGAGLLEREQWVVPLTNDEKGERVPVNLKRLAEDYDDRYEEQWTAWLRDITVDPPANVKEAIELYGLLSRSPRPYLIILRAVEDNTQWKDRNKAALENEEINREMKRRVNAKLASVTRGLRFDIDLKKIGERTSNVPGAFKGTTEFGIPPPSATGDSPLEKYLSHLELLRGQLQKEEDTRGPNLDPRLVSDRLDDATKQAQDLLQPLDEKARLVLSPLLLTPLKIVTSRLPPGGPNKVNMPGSRHFGRF